MARQYDLFEIPLVRRAPFLHDARKRIPSLKPDALEFAHKVGGIRSQLIGKDHGRVLSGGNAA